MTYNDHGCQNVGPTTIIIVGTPMPQISLRGQSSPCCLAGLSDDSLLELMREDDGAAYRVLVERHIDRAYGLALRILRNVADAEDVAQDAMVRAWTSRQHWQGGKAKFSTWLYRVIVNRCIDLQRRVKTKDIADVDEPADECADSITVIHRSQVYGKLETAMASLPVQQRAALTLAYFDDLGNDDIAEILGTTVSAVESLLKRGRQSLRGKLRRAEREIRQLFADG